MEILKHYLHSALWTAELDKDFDIVDFDSTSVANAKIDIRKFLSEAKPYLNGVTDEMIGHDFWLTRNHHGAGFWDRKEIADEDGKKLTEICHKFPEKNVFASKNEVIIE